MTGSSLSWLCTGGNEIPCAHSSPSAIGCDALIRQLFGATLAPFFSNKRLAETARDDLIDGKDQAIDVSKVDVSMNGIELQDREFVAAIRDRREPNASVAQVLPCYRTLHELDRQLQEQS